MKNKRVLGLLSWLLWVGFAASTAGAPLATGTAVITVHVENVLPAGGMIRLGVYDETHYPDDNSTPIVSADIPAQPGETTVTLPGIPPGTYGIEVFQDINSNDKMDISWLGLPLEPFGFSQDARPFLSKPAFDEVKFAAAPGENVQTIHLQNFGSTSPADKARDAIRARQRQ